MKFVFVCPEENRVFESAEFRVIDNQGVVSDEDGNKIFEAKVALEKPCPLCGNQHVYHASELSCPFVDLDRIEED